MKFDMTIEDLRCCGNCERYRIALFCDVDKVVKKSWYSCKKWKFDGFNSIARGVDRNE